MLLAAVSASCTLVWGSEGSARIENCSSDLLAAGRVALRLKISAGLLSCSPASQR